MCENSSHYLAHYGYFFINFAKILLLTCPISAYAGCNTKIDFAGLYLFFHILISVNDGFICQI
ncbi:MAG: hypothetical protein EBX41_01280 [Chitinophagia bacterium]|nr:hypothetical protein [Chitinophagia bacterium]